MTGSGHREAASEIPQETQQKLWLKVMSIELVSGPKPCRLLKPRMHYV